MQHKGKYPNVLFIISIIIPILLWIFMAGCSPAEANSEKYSGGENMIGKTSANNSDYRELWKKVEDFTNQGLPKSALKVVQQIYAAAKKNNDAGNFLKAVIHKLKYLQEVEEESLVKIQAELINDIKTSKTPIVQILHSMLAEQYWHYFQSNRWRIFQRTTTAEEFKQDDIRTWSARKIVETVMKHYEKSLEDAKKTKKIAIQQVDEILYQGSSQGRKYRPTLYDFLAHRAIDFYMNSQAGLTQPKYQFTLNNKDYLQEAEKFAQMHLATKDKDSFQFHALKYLQDLIIFHIDDKEPEALVDVDLKRLHFVYQQGIISNKEIIYEKTLLKMVDKYSGVPITAEIYYQLGDLYDKLGDRYNPELPEDDYRWYKKKAHELCREAIKKYPQSVGAINCKTLINRIETKSLQLTLEKAAVRHQPSRGLLQYRNIDKTYFKIIKTDSEEISNKHSLRREDMINFFLKKRPLKTWEIQLPDDGDYQPHAAEIKIDSMEWGVYILLASNTQNFDYKNNVVAYNFFNISNIAYIHRNRPEKGLEFYMVDRDTGQPLKDARAQLWKRTYDKVIRKYVKKKSESVQADNRGYLNITRAISPDNHFYIELSNEGGKDRLFIDQTFNVYRPHERNQQHIRTFFFTDRAIYRPGQTVYFKGIVLRIDTKDGEKNQIMKNFNTQVTLYDVNHQKINELNLESNDFGTFSGSFQLPTGVLNGNMRITDNYGGINFSMEEYKRPKFRVSFESLEKTFRINDNVTVKGEAKAYAGYNIDNAEVKYRVVRNVFFPYSWYYRSYRNYGIPRYTQPMEIANGITNTNAEGKFEVSFEAIPDLSLPQKINPAFCYTVYADVTDINGETQRSQKQVYIGYTALKLIVKIDEHLNKDQKDYKISINSTNLSGDFVKAEGDIAIYRLNEPDKFYRKRLWQKADKFIINKDDYHKNFPYDIYNDEDNITNWEKGKKVFFTKFDTGELKELKLTGLNQWQTGKYQVEMLCKDRYGNQIKEIKYFTLYSAHGTKVPFPIQDWYTVIKGTAEPGERAVLLIGSSDKNVRVVYEVEYRGKIIKTQDINLNNEQKRITIPIHEEHRGNLGVHFTFIKHNRMHTHNCNIRVPWSNKKLNLSFETFRDKLQPGEKEKWRIKIRGPQGEKVAAEMVATLYDASLDAFRTNSWSFNIFPYHHIRYGWNTNPFFSTISTNTIGKLKEISQTIQKSYDHLNWFGFSWRGSLIRYKSRGRLSEPAAMPMRDEAPVESETLLEESVATKQTFSKKKNEIAGDKMSSTSPAEQEITKEQPESGPIKLRTNFNETAFFYPHLRTTPEGDILIEFTIPEALTKWKMLGFAHTQNLENGFLYNQLITQKDLMVVPNTPRFFREGDTIVFTSKITNLSGEMLKGTATLKLYDSVTMQPVDEMFKNQQSEITFTAQKGQSDLVSWRLEIPEELDAVTYRLSARAGNFSDGEEQAVPILKNRMLVTESMPLPVHANETQSFTFEKLVESSSSKTLKQHKFTLEFTSNPVWYAVQALPYIMEYPHECMEQVFSRYYANSMASHIVNANPKIKRVFDIWKSAGKDSPNANALLSNLEKNQELKTILLEETPWVLNGQNETQRKQRVALLFDLNTMASQLTGALKKLKEGQLASGAWPWFKGMMENRYITQHIVCGFAHLQRLKIIDTRENAEMWNMIKRAVLYTDKEINEDFQRLKKYNIDLNKNNLGYIQIHYLYARSNFQDIPLDNRDIKAFEYYKGQVKRYWNNFIDSKYMQGMMALILKRYQDTETATAIGNSLKEHALYSDEMGMYWKIPYGYYWYQAPIETQALLIEVFDEVMNDAESVDQLKTWLLKQKQTQDWRTTKATVDACYALLLRGEDWLEESQSPEITLGKANPITIIPGKNDSSGEKINVEAGTGYFKKSWTSKEVKPEMGYIKVKNNNKIAAWGSVYWQYFENLDKITSADTPLKLKKKLFIEKSSDTGPVLNPLEKADQLKIGDRVKVRIQLQVDRDMEYVHMKDMRASCLEPEDVISMYRWQDGLGYYQSTKDASTNFFIDYLKKGTYIFEYGLRVTHEGNFSNGITQIQCMYAPEFTSHSQGIRISPVSKK